MENIVYNCIQIQYFFTLINQWKHMNNYDQPYEQLWSTIWTTMINQKKTNIMMPRTFNVHVAYICTKLNYKIHLFLNLQSSKNRLLYNCLFLYTECCPICAAYKTWQTLHSEHRTPWQNCITQGNMALLTTVVNVGVSFFNQLSSFRYTVIMIVMMLCVYLIYSNTPQNSLYKLFGSCSRFPSNWS
jgi:hypothetical protein